MLTEMQVGVCVFSSILGSNSKITSSVFSGKVPTVASRGNHFDTARGGGGGAANTIVPFDL